MTCILATRMLVKGWLTNVRFPTLQLFETALHVHVSLESLKERHVTAALLFVKENPKTWNCSCRKPSLRQETGLQADLKSRRQCPERGSPEGSAKAKDGS